MQLRAALRRIAGAQMQQDPSHDLAHLDRVWANASLIARAEHGVDLQVLLGAAYLHDLVNLPKDAPDRAMASARSAQAAAPILGDLGFSEMQIAAAQHAIAAHSFSAKTPAESIEAMILRDADRLDALGAIGIARTFVVAGSLGRALYDPDDPFATKRALDDQVWSIDHWQKKLLQLPHDMTTILGREIATKRAAHMRAYLIQLGDEIGAALPDSWTLPRT